MREKSSVLWSVLLMCAFLLATSYAHAQSSTDDLQSKIDSNNANIASLEKEIAVYQSQLNTLGTQASSLSSTIQSLDITDKKLKADITVTEDKIATKNLEIQRIASQIVTKEGDISDDHRIVIHALTTMSELDSRSIIEIFLASRSIADAWNDLSTVATVEGSVMSHIDKLESDKSTLETNKSASEKAKTDLVTLSNQLALQRKVVLSTEADKNSLLNQTKQSQTQFAALLAQKKSQETALEQEILTFESQLQLVVDPSKLPAPGTNVLTWPLDAIYVTQYFGNTPFSTANPQIYNGKGHTGVDFRASIGTPVKAALDGIVVGEGNTDLIPGCYSFGKWIMLKHADGLSTLYAHLSLQGVTVGQSVTTGEFIGYSGNTGYTTGPHLHFGVYATQGTEIKLFDTSVNCKGAIIPIATLKAYLNPLSYLPVDPTPR